MTLDALSAHVRRPAWELTTTPDDDARASRLFPLQPCRHGDRRCKLGPLDARHTNISRVAECQGAGSRWSTNGGALGIGPSVTATAAPRREARQSRPLGVAPPRRAGRWRGPHIRVSEPRCVSLRLLSLFILLYDEQEACREAGATHRRRPGRRHLAKRRRLVQRSQAAGGRQLAASTSASQQADDPCALRPWRAVMRAWERRKCRVVRHRSPVSARRHSLRRPKSRSTRPVRGRGRERGPPRRGADRRDVAVAALNAARVDAPARAAARPIFQRLARVCERLLRGWSRQKQRPSCMRDAA
jgi:hypothetical protein